MFCLFLSLKIVEFKKLICYFSQKYGLRVEFREYLNNKKWKLRVKDNLCVSSGGFSLSTISIYLCLIIYQSSHFKENLGIRGYSNFFRVSDKVYFIYKEAISKSCIRGVWMFSKIKMIPPLHGYIIVTVVKV